MNYTIVGFKYVNFVDEKGKTVNGYKVCLLSNNDDPNLDEGQLAFNKFFSARSISGNIRVGAICSFKISMSGNSPILSGLDIIEN